MDSVYCNWAISGLNHGKHCIFLNNFPINRMLHHTNFQIHLNDFLFDACDGLLQIDERTAIGHRCTALFHLQFDRLVFMIQFIVLFLQFIDIGLCLFDLCHRLSLFRRNGLVLIDERFQVVVQMLFATFNFIHGKCDIVLNLLQLRLRLVRYLQSEANTTKCKKNEKKNLRFAYEPN